MIRRLRTKLVNWGAFGRIDDELGDFDDYRRRVQQEEATLRRIARLRLVAKRREARRGQTAAAA